MRYNSEVSADHGYVLPPVNIECIQLDNAYIAPYEPFTNPK
jgi:hypothetical protein